MTTITDHSVETQLVFDLTLTEAQESLRERVHAFAKDTLRPGARAAERDGGLGRNVGGTQTGPHLHHVAYYLDNPNDILRTATMLVDYGHEPEFGPANHGTSGATCLYFKEPSGNRIELWTGGILMFAPKWEALEWNHTLFAAVGDLWGSSHAPERFMFGTSVAPALVAA